MRKNCAEAAEHCRALRREYPWIDSEAPHFGKPGTDYDWEGKSEKQVDKVRGSALGGGGGAGTEGGKGSVRAGRERDGDFALWVWLRRGSTVKVPAVWFGFKRVGLQPFTVEG